MQDKKIKVLAYCDSPTCATGFGTVSRNIFEALYNTGRYDIDILGINYWGNPHEYPYRIWPTGTNPDHDPYGRKKVANMIPTMDFDILFFLQDTFILDFLPELMPYIKHKRAKPFKSICYYPIDGTPKESWLRNVDFCDNKVAFSPFGKEESLNVYPSLGDVSIIPHGVNTDVFKVLPEEDVKRFREQYFGRVANKFIFMNLNRNQQRKDIPRTLQAFAELRKEVPDSVLYLHMARHDVGWNLPEVCKSYGFSISEDVIFPEHFGPNAGYPIEVVNMLYNCVDCVINTCQGEGWGLSWIEAMATKTPVIMPNNTTMANYITEDKGYLVNSGTNPSLFTVLPNDNEIIRPLVDVEDMAAKMVHVCNNYGEAMKKAENAYRWVKKEMDWQGPIAQQWVDLFDSTYKSIHEDIEGAEILDNDSKVIDSEVF